MRRRFPESALRAIEAAIAEGEQRHEPEIRFAVEGRARSARASCAGSRRATRAIDVFSELRVWDTEHNTGVLIYLLLADRDVEIVADRGVAARVAHAEWEAICREMETELRAGRYEAGALAGIRADERSARAPLPARATRDRGEQPNRPVVL